MELRQRLLWILLLAVSLPLISGTRLTYPDNIGSFAFSWSNPDQGSTQETGPTDGSLMTDGITTIGSGETLTNPVRGMWGNLGAATTSGMVGTFQATTLNLAAGSAYWLIEDAKIFFDGQCFTDDTTAYAFYYDFNTGAWTKLSVTITSDANNLCTFSADISTPIKTNGYIGFHIESNAACEGDIAVLEFQLLGSEVVTPQPTTDPTTSTPTRKPTRKPTNNPANRPTTKPTMNPTQKPTRKPTRRPTSKPTPSPVTVTPTMAPTGQCKGEITWGDPWFHLMAHSNKNSPAELQYNGLGWHYYIMPCDLNQYEEWPFFLLSHHYNCWGTGCIDNNRIVLNTKPDPWVIEVSTGEWNEYVAITVGTDQRGQTARNFDTYNLWWKYRKNNPMVINYHDGDQQYGQVRIYYQSGKYVVELHDLSFPGCDGEVIQITFEGWTTAFTCPHCFRNIGCGLMGKYTRGDCTKWDVANPKHECYNILQGSDGKTYTPPDRTSVFQRFAATWSQSTVDWRLKNQYGFNVPNYLNAHDEAIDNNALMPVSEGRSVEVDTDNDNTTVYAGNCYNNPDAISAMNETCRLNTVVRYAECCAEIGICDLLWSSCVSDMCACTDPNADNDLTETDCLKSMIHQTMNATCKLEWMYPTATPTAAPTPSPTGIVAGLPLGAESTEEFVMYMVIFVILFVLIAIGAFWYYRKKAVKGVHSFEDDPDGDIDLSSKMGTSGYNQAETHAQV